MLLRSKTYSKTRFIARSNEKEITSMSILTGEVALVTGATRGIGLAILLALGKAGASVVGSAPAGAVVAVPASAVPPPTSETAA